MVVVGGSMNGREMSGRRHPFFETHQRYAWPAPKGPVSLCGLLHFLTVFVGSGQEANIKPAAV